MVNSNAIINFLAKKAEGAKNCVLQKININNYVYEILNKVKIKYETIKNNIISKIELIKTDINKILSTFIEKIKSYFDKFAELLKEIIYNIKKYILEKCGISQKSGTISFIKNNLKDFQKKIDTKIINKSDILLSIFKNNINQINFNNNINNNNKQIISDIFNEEKKQKIQV